MRRSVLLPLFALALLAGTVLAVAPARAGEPVKVHLIVVNGVVEGRDVQAELMKLKNLFMDKAGGFTELGPTAGGEVTGLSLGPQGVSAQGGVDKRGNNYTFLVSADRDMTAEFKAYIADRFKKAPYILVWDAMRE
ncbi:MAG: hypothetical protein AB7D57_10310 [Desulfovibrionaceae bacterium]